MTLDDYATCIGASRAETEVHGGFAAAMAYRASQNTSRKEAQSIRLDLMKYNQGDLDSRIALAAYMSEDESTDAPRPLRGPTEGPSPHGAGPLSRRVFVAAATIMAAERPGVPGTDPRGLSEPLGDRSPSLLRAGS